MNSASLERVQVGKVVRARTPDEEYWYQVGMAEGNRIATFLLTGVPCPIRLVEDPSVPEGHCELHVRTMSDVKLPSLSLGIIEDR